MEYRTELPWKIARASLLYDVERMIVEVEKYNMEDWTRRECNDSNE